MWLWLSDRAIGLEMWLRSLPCRLLGHKTVWVTTAVNRWWADGKVCHGYRGYHLCRQCEQRFTRNEEGELELCQNPRLSLK